MINLINKKRSIPFLIFYTLFAIGINYCGSFLAETIVFPLYLDSVLSISVVALCGFIPGLICALGSNVLLSIFTHSTYLFSICHVMTVTFAWIVFNLQDKKSDNPYTLDIFLWAGFWAAISNGIVGNMIANLVFAGNTGRPSANIVVQGIYGAILNLSFANNYGGILENIADKTLSTCLSYGFYKLVLFIGNKKNLNIYQT